MPCRASSNYRRSDRANRRRRGHRAPASVVRSRRKLHRRRATRIDIESAGRHRAHSSWTTVRHRADICRCLRRHPPALQSADDSSPRHPWLPGEGSPASRIASHLHRAREQPAAPSFTVTAGVRRPCLDGKPGSASRCAICSSTACARKFLRGAATEMAQVTESFTRLALSQPSLHLSLRHNGKLVPRRAASAACSPRALLRRRVRRQCIWSSRARRSPWVLCRRAGLRARRHADAVPVLNGRWVRDRAVAGVLELSRPADGGRPVAFLFLELPRQWSPSPTSEVRFRTGECSIHHTVRQRVQRRPDAPCASQPEPMRRPTVDDWQSSVPHRPGSLPFAAPPCRRTRSLPRYAAIDPPANRPQRSLPVAPLPPRASADTPVAPVRGPSRAPREARGPP